MSKTSKSFRSVAAVLVAVSLAACGTAHGATGQALALNDRPSGIHLTEFATDDTQPGLLQDGGEAAGDAGSGIALVP